MKQKKPSNENPDSISGKPALEGVEQRSVVLRHAEHLQSSENDLIAQEVPIAIAYNGQSHAVMMATPIDLHDFAVGFSISERIVDTADDIRAIEIREAAQGITIQLHIKSELAERLNGKRRQLSGRSGCGICGISDLAAAIPEITPLPDSKLPSHTIIDNAVESMQSVQAIQQQCGAVHCAALFSATGELIAWREDVGRHNALDKLLGNQVGELRLDQFIVMSSRASHELIAKIAINGIGTLVAVSAATSLAIDLAEKSNLNLVGFVRESRQIIYTN